MNERVMPEHFGGTLWVDQTVVHPVGFAVLVIALLAMVVLPRRHQLLPLIFIAVALPGAQRIALLSLDFTFVRIVILATLIVAMLQGQFRTVRWGLPDKLLCVLSLWNLLASGVLSGGVSGVVTSAGGAIDTLGVYLLGRAYLRSFQDLRHLLLFFAVISLPMLVFFMLEQLTARNLFSMFGGVPEETMLRNGRLRAQGPFSHPIMAGVCWATILPCLIALWQSRTGARLLVGASIFCIPLIVIACASSTPVVALAGGYVGLALYMWRRYMQHLFMGVLAVLIALQVFMNMSVWHLMARIDLAGGSTGWHRYNLIEQAINHFGEWWAFGTHFTGHWGWGLQDITNQYVLEGVDGGILQMMLFMTFLFVLFLRLGRAQRLTRSRAESRLLWGMAVALFVHCLSFIAVSYFGQMVCLFYVFCGAVAAFTEPRLPARAATGTRGKVPVAVAGT